MLGDTDPEAFIELMQAEEGYLVVKQLPSGQWIGIHPLLFTVGLFYGLDEHGVNGRFCYPDLFSAIAAMADIDTPSIGYEHEAPGNWIVHKGVRTDCVRRYS